MPAMPSALFVARGDLARRRRSRAPATSATIPPTKRRARATMRSRAPGASRRCRSRRRRPSPAGSTGASGQKSNAWSCCEVPLLRRERVGRREREPAAARAEPLDPADAVDAPHAANAATPRRRARAAAELAADAAVGCADCSATRGSEAARSTPTAKRAASRGPPRRRARDGRGRQGGRASHCSDDLRRQRASPSRARHDARAVDAAGRRRCEAEPAGARRQRLRDGRPAPSRSLLDLHGRCPGTTGRDDVPVSVVRSRARLERQQRRDRRPSSRACCRPAAVDAVLGGRRGLDGHGVRAVGRAARPRGSASTPSCRRPLLELDVGEPAPEPGQRERRAVRTSVFAGSGSSASTPTVNHVERRPSAVRTSVPAESRLALGADRASTSLTRCEPSIVVWTSSSRPARPSARLRELVAVKGAAPSRGTARACRTGRRRRRGTGPARLFQTSLIAAVRPPDVEKKYVVAILPP